MRRVLTFLTASRAVAGVAGRRRVHGRPAVLAARPAVAAAGGRRLPTRGRHRHAGTARARRIRAGERRVRHSRGRGVGESRARRGFARLVSHVSRPTCRSSAISSPTTRPACCRPALVARPLAAMAVGLALADGRIASLDSPGRALPARMGRRSAWPHHHAAAPRGNQRARDRRRHPRPAVSLALGRSCATCRRSRPPGACACC